MRHTLLYILFLCFPLGVMAQSSMSDEQVLEYVAREYQAGTSQAQIVTKLMQRGVTIQQIQRVRKKYERQIKQNGMGTLADKATEDAVARMRQNNGQLKQQTPDYSNSNTRIANVGYANTYDDNDPDFLVMQQEMSGILPTDSIAWLNQLLEQQERDRKQVFGHQFFNNKNLTFEPNMNIATPENYRIGPGDAVIVDVYGATQKSMALTVSPDGEITIEGFGPVKVDGLTVAQANQRLRNTLGSRYASSKIKLTVGQTKTIMVNVMGEVNAPGTYTLSAFATVFHALYMAGGPNDLGTLRNIKVYRNNKLVTTVDVYDYMLNGKLSGNIRLADNDVISVETYDCLVNITGKVKRPMYFEMKKDESVATLLNYAGGFTGDAYTRYVRLIRKTGREYSVHNVGEFEMGDFRIADGDSLFVDSILPRFANSVEVKGAVFRPGMYQLGGNINSVRSLIENAEGITEEAFTNRAIIHRLKEDRSLEVIAVDLAGVLAGTIADVPLRENDVLFVPTKSEKQIERSITIHGEVQFPGVYKYADNETLEDFILQAGGLTDMASTVKVDVARRIFNPQATTSDNTLAQNFSFALKEGFVVDGQPGFVLMPYDEVYVRKSPTSGSQKNVFVTGEIVFDGTYTLSQHDMRLSDLVKMAGGITQQAFVAGARLERRTTEDERLRMRTVLNVLKQQSSSKDTIDVNTLNLGDTYYVGIELDKAMANPGSDADIVLREGDHLLIPKYSNTVKVSGAVIYPNTVSFEQGKHKKYYVNLAGGWGNRAKKSHTIVVYQNGRVARAKRSTKILPGSEIIVPAKPESSGMKIGEWLTIGTSVASIATMIATIANVLK